MQNRAMSCDFVEINQTHKTIQKSDENKSKVEMRNEMRQILGYVKIVKGTSNFNVCINRLYILTDLALH